MRESQATVAFSVQQPMTVNAQSVQRQALPAVVIGTLEVAWLRGASLALPSA